MLRLQQMKTGEAPRLRRTIEITSKPKPAPRRNRKPLLEVLEDRQLLSGNTYTVSNTGDTGSGSGLSGDLLYCVAQANENSGSTIQFESGLTGTIQLTSGLHLSANVTINGPASAVAVAGGGSSSNFSVFTVNSNVSATISGLTITNGYSSSGGALVNLGAVTLTDDTFADNSASFDGGGVSNYGRATFTNDTFANNSAYLGGGIANQGTATLINATIAGNAATVAGGVWNDATAALDNTIVANNASGGDIDNSASLSGSYDLIGDGSGTVSLAHSLAGNPLLAAPGNYGGTTQTMALLPGSPAIDAGAATIAGVKVLATDQRGLGRVGNVDIGAFESQGFTLSPVAGSTPQTTYLNAAFTNALAVTVTAKNSVEPVNGGVVSFTAPTSGASTTLSATTATIAGGTASVTATANSTLGTYKVTASDAKDKPASFTLTNGVFTVTSTGDSGSGSGLSGDLLYCITQANEHPDSMIQFGSGGTGTIQLTGGLTLSANVTINGPGESLLVEGGGSGSHFSVFTVNAGVTASISGLTISNGTSLSGGGVDNAGTLTLTSDTLSANVATNDGGGVYNAPGATLTLTSDTLSANATFSSFHLADQGGGLANYGTATLTNDTFANNSAPNGGGIDNAGTATLINDTIVGNTAYVGGGVRNSGTMALDNTIVAKSSHDKDISNSASLSGSDDLIGDGSDLASLSASQGGNPLLVALGSYGGTTQTMALLPGSPAIDAGAATITGVTIPTVDQRGLGRVGGVDLGAFESQGFTMTPVVGSSPQATLAGTAFAKPLDVTVLANNPVEPVDGGVVSFAAPTSGATAVLSATTATITAGTASVTAVANGTVGQYSVSATDPAAAPATFSLANGAVYTVTDTTDLGSGSGLSGDLRYCINQANETPGSTIEFGSGVTGSINLGSGLNLSADTIITGAGASIAVIGNGPYRVFVVDSGVTATISGLTITEGELGYGGGVSNGGVLTLTDDTIVQCQGWQGAGVYNGGVVTLINDTITQNVAGVGGGGVFNDGTAILINDTIVGNTSFYWGGGISNSTNATMELDNSIVTNNNYHDQSNIPSDLSDQGTIFGGSDMINDILWDGGTDHLTNALTGKPLLASLGNYGGTTQTMALLPGSPAIDAGNTALAVDARGNPLTTDQRGMKRVVGAAVDIGAVESGGFTLTPVPASSPQTTLIDAAFTNPLTVSVAANNKSEPVDSGFVTFAAPSSGASATLSATTVTILAGTASVTATANGRGGCTA
ncbi:MAG: beta strand repeat-containing protein [Isosphaerales bacterium]